MSIWLHYNEDEKLVMLQQTAAAKNVIEQAVEKDWWVSVILKTLSKTSWADFLQFKGGTSLSKAWGLINRFSEDIDLAISRSFFGLPENTRQQRTAIRRKSFHYIKEILIEEINNILISSGINGCQIELVTRNSSAMVTTIEVRYNNIQGIDYQTHYPATIQICPPEKLLNNWRNDYENLRESFIYDKSKKTFDELIARMLELTNKIRKMNLKTDK